MVPLGQTNYPIWSIRQCAELEGKGYWDVVEDGIQHAPEGSSAAVRTAAAESVKLDRKARALIISNVSDEHLPALGDCETAQEVWEHLKAHFSGNSHARRLLLRLELNAMAKSSSESLASFVSRCRTLRQALINAGEDVTEAQLVTILLVGLPDEYAMVRTVITMGDTDQLKLSEVEAKLAIVELQTSKKINDEDSARAYMVGSRGGRGGSGGRFAGRGGRGGNAGRFGGRGGHDDRNCWNCGEPGHISRYCPAMNREKNYNHPAMAMIGMYTRPAY